MLKRLAELPDSFRTGCLPICAPTTPDDTALLSSTKLGAQAQILVAQDDANNHRYGFSSAKTKVQIVNNKPHEIVSLSLNKEPIEISLQETHLGVQRTPDGKASATVKERIKSARRTAYSLMGAGLHGLNGTGPKVAKHLIDVYVTPVLLHSLEALILSESDYKSLELFYRTLLRQVQHLPSNCANPAVYLLIGSIPIEGQIHIRMLTFFCSVIRRPSIGKQVIQRQLAIKDAGSNSWTVQIRNILTKYSLPSAFQLFDNPPSNREWKTAVKESVRDYWLCHLQEKAATMSTLQLLDPQNCDLENLHSTWVIDANPMEVHMATVKAKLLVQRY